MFFFLLYNSSWMADTVFGGTPGAPGAPGELYDLGVRAAAMAMCLHSLVSMLVSPVLPRIIAALGAVNVYGLSHLYFAALLAASPFVRSVPAAYALVAACGVHFTVIVTLPFALVAASSRATGGQDGALTLGVLNVFVVLPQLAVALFGGLLLHAVAYNFASVLVVAAGFAVVAAGCIFRLIKVPAAIAE